MKEWKPEQKPCLPAPSQLYHELEAAAEFGYTVSEWMREKVIYRAMAMAHVTEKAIREGYTHEHNLNKDKKKTSWNPIDAMKAQWGWSG